MVGRETDLEPAAERRAVDRRDDRAAERLEPAQLALDVADALRELARLLRRDGRRSCRSPPAKNVFLPEVMTTPLIEPFSASSRSIVAPIDAM